ncbi:MAG TPA: hypothetical protein VM368_07665 [Flavisolibacter sp.]|nr:hypothetical protein [Flavisolibacter sp.]
MIQDPVQPNLIVVGTEHGLWISLDNGETFEQWKNGYPQVSTYDLAIQEREADLAIGSFGRSIWILDDIRPLRQMAANSGKNFTKRLTAFPAPDAYQITYKPAPGYEWSTYGLWDAPNRPRGAPVSYFIAPTKDTARAARVDSVQVRIYNDKNELIRNLKWKADTGMNRQWWGMEEKGFRTPGSPRPRTNAPEPGGMQVLPGTYKVVLTLGKDADSTMVTVKDDPRIKKTQDVVMAQRRMIERLRNSTDKLTAAMDRLTEAEETLTKMQTQLAGLEGKEIDSLRKATTIMRDSIKSIREYISGRTSDKQGITRFDDITVMSTIRTAQQYITGKTLAPGTQEEALVKNAEQLITAAVARTNRFFATSWANYRKHVEGTRIGLFKDYKPID